MQPRVGSQVHYQAHAASPAFSELKSLMVTAPGEGDVLRYLPTEAIGTDDVIRKSGLASSAVSVALLSLEMKRLIRQLPG